MECYSAMKKNERMPQAATWMDPETIILTEASHREAEMPRTSLTCGIQRNGASELPYKTERDSQP